MFWGGLKGWDVDSHCDFKYKVVSQEAWSLAKDENREISWVKFSFIFVANINIFMILNGHFGSVTKQKHWKTSRRVQKV